MDGGAAGTKEEGFGRVSERGVLRDKVRNGDPGNICDNERGRGSVVRYLPRGRRRSPGGEVRLPPSPSKFRQPLWTRRTIQRRGSAAYREPDKEAGSRVAGRTGGDLPERKT